MIVPAGQEGLLMRGCYASVRVEWKTTRDVESCCMHLTFPERNAGLVLAVDLNTLQPSYKLGVQTDSVPHEQLELLDRTQTEDKI